MKFDRIVAAAAVGVLLGASGAAALSVSVSGGITEAAPSVAQNSFAAELSATGIDKLTTGPGVVLSLSGPAILTFTEVAEESFWASKFTFGGGTAAEESMDESVASSDNIGTKAANFLTDSMPGTEGGESFSKLLQAGDFQSLLSFSTTGRNGVEPKTFSTATNGFGVFYNAAANTANTLTTFFLALDDSGGRGDDDNHEDYIVRVDVAAVPLPAAAWLLLGVSGALVTAKRRQHRKTA